MTSFGDRLTPEQFAAIYEKVKEEQEDVLERLKNVDFGCTCFPPDYDGPKLVHRWDCSEEVARLIKESDGDQA